ncbi:glycosyltransferase family 2 protein [Rasiella sp. SM2506]|uniref:glycosyltransferase family 2 protein n=1 Tax=Rasiella sp. SM2506 TaxID=3423914 RepID=UPI003D790EA1
MLPNEPLVSIIIPTFNRAILIKETLDSIQIQTYKNWECIVVDDGSTDNTKEVVEKYQKENNRFHFYRRPNDYLPGGNGARNFGLKMCKGDFVNWFDSDDVMVKNKLEIQLKIFEEQPFDFVVSQCSKFIGETSNIIGLMSKRIFSENPFEDFVKKNIKFSTPSVLFKKTFLTQNKFTFDEELKAGQEWEFFSRILQVNPSVGCTLDSLSLIRVHDQSISDKKNSIETIWNYTLARVKIYWLLKRRDELENFKAFFKSYFKYNFFIFVSAKEYAHVRFMIKKVFPGLFSPTEILKASLFYILRRYFGRAHKLKNNIFED